MCADRPEVAGPGVDRREDRSGDGESCEDGGWGQEEEEEQEERVWGAGEGQGGDSELVLRCEA